MITEDDRVAQCRYCPTCSNQGKGVWFAVLETEYWICRRCVAEIVSVLSRDELEYWAKTSRK